MTMAVQGTATSPSVLWKAFDVLGAFTHDDRTLTLTEISRRSDLPKSTTHRILAMLIELGALEHTDEGYAIGLRIFTIGSVSRDRRIRDVALPYLERLRRQTRQTVHLAVLDEGHAVYLEKLPTLASPRTPALVGGRLPAHLTGVGKALLAFSGADAQPSAPQLGLGFDGLSHELARVRSAGVAEDHEQAARGLACMAAPIMVSERAVAALSVAYASADGNGKRFETPVRETAVAIGRALAGQVCRT
jgi:DNA-binding IclR family transcriptional regulator